MKRFAKGRTPRRPGVMNKTEQAYATLLEQKRIAGEVAAYWFESVRFVLAPNTSYTPDFLVQLPDSTLEVHEVKGFWEDDARVKIKVAADKFPFVFRAFRPRAKKNGGGWDEEVIGGSQ